MLLKKLGINSKLTPIKIRKNKNSSITLTWRLNVTGIKNIKRFNQLIGFDDKEKNAKVEKILLRFRKYNRYEDCVDAVKYLISKKSSFTYQEFSKIVGVCGDRGLFHLRRLIADGIVIRDSENCYWCTI